MRCGWRGKLTAGGWTRNGPLDPKNWGLTEREQRRAGPRLYEAQKGAWDTKGKRCTFSRRLAAAGIATWADVTNTESGEWLTTQQASRIYGLEAGRDCEEYARVIQELEGEEWAELRTEWREMVGSKQTDGRNPSAHNEVWARWRHGTWEVDEILAARRAPTCLGGWEYKVRWKEEGVDTWEPAINMTTRDMAEDMKRAQEQRYLPTNFREWLEIETEKKTPDARASRYAIATCEGKKASGGWSEVWRLFVRYQSETVQQDVNENLPDIPASEGGRDTRSWEPSERRTCYLGNKEEYEDEKGEKRMRMVPGLDPHEPWEMDLPAELKVTYHTVQDRVEEDLLMGETGTQRMAIPEHQPHLHVDMTEGSHMLWKGQRNKAVERTCERLPTLDPVLRLFLRWDVVENGEEVRIGGVRGRMDRDEQKSLGSDTGSVCESARLMRTAMHLHYEHHFTHAASVDGSKAGTIKTHTRTARRSARARKMR